ncbi:GNAT family N-acetyltransferase [bacterium]|nr:MAG: GNAT family N-acetyltransferase [bacterium]
MIRPLKKLDDPLWPALLALYEAAFDRDSREPNEQLEAEIQAEYRLPFQFLVDEKDGELRGFARWCDLGYAGFLIHLAADPKCQGGGIGTGLMKAVLAESERMLLEAHGEDERLMRFYRRFSARILTPNYVQPALHADTEPVAFSLIGIGTFEDPKGTVEAFYRDIWELPPDHPFVLQAVEGVR